MKRSIILILCILLCFAVNCFADGATHHNDNYYDYGTYNTTENTYNNYNDTDYHYDVDQTYNYDHSINSTTNNYINIDNSGVIENQAIQLHNDINSEADSLNYNQITNAKYYGAPIASPGSGLFVNYTKLYFNPAQVIAKVKPDGFAQFHITVTSDSPITLKIAGDQPNIKILSPEITIDHDNGTASTEVIVTFPKGTYWAFGNIIFKSVNGLELGRVKVNFDNAYGIDHISRMTIDNTYTSIGHGVKQSRGSWGWAGFVGYRINRVTNDETVYATLTYDW
ncbi:MAG: hypothetical protein ACFFDY_01245 [Candidatus Thorarchaeota archaeon]